MSVTFTVEGFYDPEQAFWNQAIGQTISWAGLRGVADATHTLVAVNRADDGGWNLELDNGLVVHVTIHV